MRSALIAIAFLVVGLGAGFEAATHWDALESHARAVLTASSSSSAQHDRAAYGNGAISLSDSSDEVRDHFLGPHLSIRTSDRSVDTFGDNSVNLNIVISPNGSVVSAAPSLEPKAYLVSGNTPSPIPNGPVKFFRTAERLAMQWRFIPFERSGRPVYAQIKNMGIPVYPSERRPDYRKAFPPIVNWNSLKITLDRTMCYGSCPDYRLEIHGDGSVLYDGRASVALMGIHRATVSRTVVEHVVQSFWRADYFSLFNSYNSMVTDNPSETTSISFDGRTKKVYDYVGEQDGMPDAVADVEEEIDRAVDSTRWVKGNSETGASLVAEGWDFHSQNYDNLTMLAGVAESGSIEAVNDLIAAGAPLGPIPTQHTKGGDIVWSSALENAAERGDADIAAVLVQAGAAKDQNLTKKALISAARNGQLRMVRLLTYALENKPDFKPEDGAVIAASSSCVPDILTSILKFDPDVNEVAKDGSTPLMAASHDAPARGYSESHCDQTVALLLKAGARVNAQNRFHESALMKASFAPEVAKILIAGGADVNAKDNLGRTALSLCFNIEVCRLLLRAGADPYARDHDGMNAFEKHQGDNLGESQKIASLIREWMATHPPSQYKH